MEKLQNTPRSSQEYLSLFKIFLNNKRNTYHFKKKKVFVTDFKKKIELFNSFFADQRFLIGNNSELPNELEYLTQTRLSWITFSAEDIAKILEFIQNLDHNKAHGHDQVSIRMLKLFSTSICKPLEIIFYRCLEIENDFLNPSGF